MVGHRRDGSRAGLGSRFRAPNMIAWMKALRIGRRGICRSRVTAGAAVQGHVGYGVEEAIHGGLAVEALVFRRQNASRRQEAGIANG